MIEPIGTWVLQQACDAFAGWQRRFGQTGLEYITVNVSTRQLMQQNFLHIVERRCRSRASSRARCASKSPRPR